ncbi:MAG TPA: TonB C-terminal domain-containing protein, partial [Candidatus Baltobacteraceae bacterium]|nr:TonB C-terminal domain-containing protein [Candidatus Baltobacteraceae bacterium]
WTFVPAAAGCQSLPGESEFTVGGDDATFADPCNHEAKATLVFRPEMPDVVAQTQVPVHGEVIVWLDQFGELTKLQISRSTGNTALDDRLKRAAMASNYLPKVKDCMPVAGSYIFSMDGNL